jgi:hypothetical protein
MYMLKSRRSSAKRIVTSHEVTVHSNLPMSAQFRKDLDIIKSGVFVFLGESKRER